MESPVRDAVRRQLPGWARPEVDSAGNLWVRAGQGEPTVVLVAHLDEIGFKVISVGDDGILTVEPVRRNLPAALGRPPRAGTWRPRAQSRRSSSRWTRPST